MDASARFSKWAAIVSLGWGGLMVLAASNGGLNVIELFVALIGGSVCVVLLAVSVAGAVSAAVVPRWRHRGPRLLVAAGLQVVGVVVGVLAVRTELAFHTRLAMSQGALRRYAAVMEAGEVHDEPRGIGLFYVDRAYREGDAVLFVTGQDGLMAYCGVVYSPSGVAPEAFGGRRIRGPWFAWRGGPI